MKVLVNAIKKYYSLFLPPLLTLIVMEFVFINNNMYPFGNGSIAWCDMNQQGIPLLMDFKDILSGKDGLFFNMHNAGGMNLWGVFCFFLSNPFSLLAAFVPKESMICFVNIIVILKIALSSFTAALYFRCRRKGTGSASVPLSIMYAFCGYGMLFYQNIMWLDTMYLFPVLMIGLEKLTRERKNILYIIFLSAVAVTNYYLCYMVAVFIMLYMAVYFIAARNSEYRREVCVKFLTGTLISVLISAVIWLPSLIQVMSSGRLKSVSDKLNETKFLTSYDTVLPLLFCTGFILAVLIAEILRRGKISKAQRNSLILFLLTLVPFFIEPVNLMWHTGNYMAFPARYGFITVFTGLIYCADFLTNINDGSTAIKSRIQYILISVPFLIICLYYFFSKKLIDKDFDTLTKYTSGLWGNKDSLDGLARLFIMAAVCYLIILLFFYKRWIIKQAFTLMLIAMCCVEGMNSIKLYMVSPAINNPKRTEDFISITEMSDKIQDNDFYRVKTDVKNANYNMTGALGYPSLSHYTSLTDYNFMKMQRLSGYSTVWMKAGSNGGTELTDAIYAFRYIIKEKKETDDTVFSNGRYCIDELPLYSGLGILSGNDFSDYENIPDDLTRAEVQQYLFEKIFNTDKKLITEYDYDYRQTSNISFTDNKYELSKSADVIYNIYVSGRQSIYFDCYDKFSNDLSEEYFDSLSIRVNHKTVKSNFPASDNNGLLKLGEFEDEIVTVDISANKKISCYSFGVFGLDLKLLSDTIKQTANADLQYDGHKITGTVHTDKSQTCLLSIPYNEGLIIKVNGSSVPVKRVFSDLTAFELNEGENHIEVFILPKGFIAGIILTVTGIILLFLYIRFRHKIHIHKISAAIIEIAVGFTAVCTVMLIYLFPVIMNLF